MPDPYNPWATPIFPGASAFGVGSPAEDAQRQPTIVDNLLSHIAGALGRGFMAPGQALQSTTPITSEQMIAPAQDMSTMMSAGSAPFPGSANELRMGIKAYHGSPHDFDRFDLSKIGTGEGAQAYGHGLYFAENPAVSEAYKTSITRNMDQLTDIARSHGLTGDAADMLAHQFSTGFGGKHFNDWLDGLKGAVEDPLLSPRVRAASQQMLDKSIEASDAYAKMKSPGRMYEVDINADPAHFLDWDKPLSQQPSIVQEMARNADLSHLAPGNRTRRQIEMWREGKLPNPESEPSGNVLHSALTDYGMNSANNAALTNKFSEAGIPGIKYLDQGSRGAGQGSSNYVVFNDKLIDILRKYAVPGMMGAPIFANSIGEQKS